MCHLPSTILHLKTKHDWVVNGQNHEEAWNYFASVLTSKITLLHMRGDLSLESCSSFLQPIDPPWTAQSVSSIAPSRFDLFYSRKTKGTRPFQSATRAPVWLLDPAASTRLLQDQNLTWSGKGQECVLMISPDEMIPCLPGKSQANTIPMVCSVLY